MKFTLNTPIEHNGAKYEALTLREATLEDAIAEEEFPGGEVKKLSYTLSRIAGVPFEVITKMTVTDFVRLKMAAAGLLGNDEEGGQTTGGSSPS